MRINQLLTVRITAILLCCTILIFAHLSPVLVAQETNTEPATSEDAPPKYKFNPETGLWENGIYAWNPANNKTTPLKEVNYSYNPETEQWDTDVWVYDSTAKSYVPQNVKATIENTGTNSTNQISNPVSDTQISNTGPNSKQHANTGTISNTGPESENTIEEDDKNSKFFDTYFNASISNSLNSTASSGDASVLYNTNAGSASTGDAEVVASIINMLQSSWSANGQAPAILNTTIQGGHVGDLVIDPENLSVSDSSSLGKLNVEHVETAGIQNNLDIQANSGNALVSKNTNAGDATTGDALAVAQVMNLINSSIVAGQSFIGTINVYGDLEGDVLLPESLTEQLLAAKVPTANVSLTGDLELDNKTDIVIDNNLQLASSSGNAEVSNNTNAGDAKSGNAQTDITVFNLIGEQLNSSSGLLVFVNVFGEWIGFITGAPEGSNSAFLGGGAAQSTPIAGVTALDADIERSYVIENNINISASSGNATVSSNTNAGDATTGDAYAALNLLNFVNSSLNFSNIFGVVQLNILGNWYGSFGTDTAYGGFSTNGGGIGGNPATEDISQSSNSLASIVSNATNSDQVVVLALSNDGEGSFTAIPLQDTSQEVVQEQNDQVLASTSPNTNPPSYTIDEPDSGFSIQLWQVLIAVASLLVLGRIYYNNTQVNQA